MELPRKRNFKMMTEHEHRTSQYREEITSFLESYFEDLKSEPQSKLYSAMRYSVLAGGKRLRPIFVYEFCRMCGGDWKKATPFAAAVEMIHTYSLIHDDLPCMDNDDYRRGRLTNHKVYGEAMALLAGDALLTDAFALAAGAEIPDAGRIPFAVGVLANCAGSMGMVGGQTLDILSQERTCTEQEVLDIQTRKTGALINAACVLGVLAGNGSEEQLAAASRFAGLLGLAFQIRDDMLDVIGNSQELGKAVGVDGDKNTFVRLYGPETCGSLVEKYTANAVSQLAPFPDSGYMEALARELTMRKA